MQIEEFNQWLADLRSGKFVQGKISVLKDDEDGYCCLGVLAERKVEQCLARWGEKLGKGYNLEVAEPYEHASTGWLPHRFLHVDTGAYLALLNDGQYSHIVATDTRWPVDSEGCLVCPRFPFSDIADFLERFVDPTSGCFRETEDKRIEFIRSRARKLLSKNV